MNSRTCLKAVLRCALLWVLALPGAWAGPTLAECHGMKNLVFVAHQDDDLLFMNPDIDQTIDAGGCVETVYLTAAERGEGMGYMLGRARGVRAAYAVMAGDSDSWTESIVKYGGRHQARFSLNSNPRVVLIHMRLEDPWLGKGWGSLTPLSRVESIAGTSAKALGPYGESYTRADLVAALASMIVDYQPTIIRHMDDSIAIPYTSLCWRCIGHDHPDHIASAKLVRDAMLLAPGNYDEAAYVDYPTQERGSNLTVAEIASKVAAFKRYAQDDYQYCPVPAACKEPLGTAASWVQRTYYVVRHDVPPALTVARHGSYLLFTTGERNSAANVLLGRDHRWEPLGGRTADGVVAFNWADGAAGIMTRDATGQLWIKSQEAGPDWRAWRLVPGMRSLHLPRVLTQGNGRPAFLILGDDDRLRYCPGIAPDGRLEAPCSALPVLAGMRRGAAFASAGDGGVVVFAGDREGRLWVAAQNVKKPDAWEAWRKLPIARSAGGLAAMRNAQGFIELYWRDLRSGNMMRMVRGPGRRGRVRWSVPQNLGFGYMGRPAIGLNEYGEVAVAALESVGGSLILYEAQGVTTVGANAKSAPALRTVGGQLLLVSRSSDVDQTYWLWKRANGAWEPPRLLAAPPGTGGESYSEPAPAIVPNPTPAPIPAAPPLQNATLPVGWKPEAGGTTGGTAGGSGAAPAAGSVQPS